MPFVCHPEILHKHCFSFSWELKWPQEKLKTMVMQNFGVSIMVCYGIFWSGQFCIAVVFHFSWEYADLPGESKTLRSNPVNTDTEGAIESVRMSGVSV